jgi:hypothetical protein
MAFSAGSSGCSVVFTLEWTGSYNGKLEIDAIIMVEKLSRARPVFCLQLEMQFMRYKHQQLALNFDIIIYLHFETIL